MILSYHNLGEENRHRMKAKITTEHSASSYGQPVIVLEDGGGLRSLLMGELGVSGNQGRKEGDGSTSTAGGYLKKGSIVSRNPLKQGLNRVYMGCTGPGEG